MNAEGETKMKRGGITIGLSVGKRTDEALSVDFFCGAITLLRRRGGNRLVDQAALNTLIEHLALVEAFWRTLTPVPKKTRRNGDAKKRSHD